MDVNEELKFFFFFFFFFFSGGGVGGGRVGGDQGRCEQRSEVFVKIQKKNWGGGGLGRGGGGWEVRVDVTEK